MVQAGMVFVQVNLYLQPMVLAAIIFLAVFFDSLRERRVLRLKRRSIRIEAAQEPSGLTVTAQASARQRQLPAQGRAPGAGPPRT